VRPRKRLGGLLVGAAVLFVIGTNVQAGWLFVLAALLLGAVVAGTVLPFAALRGLRAELVAPQEAEQGDEALVELRLANVRSGVRWSVVVADAHLQAVEAFVPAIRPGERVELSTLRVPARRGVLATTAVEVRSSAPFGVAERRRRLAVEATTLVLPRRFALGGLSFVEPAGSNDAGIHPSPRRGQGPEYLGIREYRPGDSMRHVHWGLTARHGQVVVREFEEERTRRLAIVVDTERDRGDAWTPLDRCCAVAASVLEAAEASGHGSRLVAATARDQVGVLARADDRDQLRWLARLAPSGMRLTDVVAGLGAGDLRGVETVVVAFPAWRDVEVGGLGNALSRLPVARVVAVPVALADGEGRAADVATLAAALRGAGVDVRPWLPGADLADALGAPAAGVPV
jgi:uncharacterized protein (DUF58 family)